MRKPFGLSVLEAELPVPALQIGVLANDPDAYSMNRCGTDMLNEMLYKEGAGAAPAMRWKDRQAIQVRQPGAWILVGDTANWFDAVLNDKVDLTSFEFSLDPVFGAERRVFRAVLGVQSELVS